jgi:hypothetical protein
MASNDEHFAIHLTACILGSHQFHLRLGTNAYVSFNIQSDLSLIHPVHGIDYP